MRRRRAVGREELRGLVDEHLEAGAPTGWFEPLYARARRRRAGVPWAAGEPHPYLTDWLDQPVAAPSGSRAVVVGCGLGDDAVELARRGFDVTAFDVAPSAVAWARRRFRRRGVDWRVADLLDLPDDLVGGFDLVVEIRTVPSLPGLVRDVAMQAVGTLAAPSGIVLVVTLLAKSSEVAAGTEGPPWPQAPSELAAYGLSGLTRLALEHPTADEAGLMEVRLTFRRDAVTSVEEAGPADLPLLPGR